MAIKHPVRSGIILLEIVILGFIGFTRFGPCTMSSRSFYCTHANLSLPLLWDKDHAAISDAGWKYWIRLDIALPKEKLQEMLENYTAEIQRLVPNPPLPHHANCAVVGNSGNLIHSGYGEAIDAHDAVFRMTVAPTKGYEKDVGTRTTYHFIYSSILYTDQGIDPKAIILYYSNVFSDTQFFINFMNWHEKRIRDPNNKAVLDLVPPENFRVLHPDFWYSLQHDWLRGEGSHPSTGIMGIVLALRLCDKVDVFGFGADKDGNWDHYYNTEHTAKKSEKVHHFDLEASIREQLENEGSIKVYKGVR